MVDNFSLAKVVDNVIIIDYNNRRMIRKGRPLMSIFSDRLVSLMRQKGITQKQLSTQTNITPSAMSYYANGSRTPSGEILAKIAKALGTSADYLLGITDVPQTSSPNPELHYLQRNLGKLDQEQLRKAEALLKTVFDDIFADEEG